MSERRNESDEPTPEPTDELAGRDDGNEAEETEASGAEERRAAEEDRSASRRAQGREEDSELLGVGGAAAEPEKLILAKETIEQLLGHMGVEAQVEVRDFAERIACRIVVEEGADAFGGLSPGQVIGALEHIANRIVNREGDARKRLALYLGDFPAEEPDPAMVAMALRLGESAKRMGKRLTVVPMHAGDRKIVHQAAAEVEGLQTRSEGEGNLRRLVVLAKGEE